MRSFFAKSFLAIARKPAPRPKHSAKSWPSTLKNVSDSTFKSLGEISAILRGQLEQVVNQSAKVADKVDLRLKELQQDNAQQIDKMRATVDEKLQGTLEKRLGESFKLVSDRLEQVHHGLGTMQQLASDVGGLQRVLTNVKTRGGWGEVQLGALLEQVLTPEQFARNVKTRRGRRRDGRVRDQAPGRRKRQRRSGCRSMRNFRSKIITGWSQRRKRPTSPRRRRR